MRYVMNKKIGIILLVTMLSIGLVACADKTEVTEQRQQIVENNAVESTEETEVTEESQGAEDDLLAELSTLRFVFYSGAGGWGEEFTIEKDGYLSGKFFDSDMGDSGDGYEDGTCYSSNYSGYITDVTYVDENRYRIKISELTYIEEIGREEILYGTRYIYTESSFFGNNDTFEVYLPGTQLEQFSEDIRLWLTGYIQSETELTMYAIVDAEHGYGAGSYERPTPLEEAQMTYATYKESYDYYIELGKEAQTTMDMKINALERYEVSDACLNDIWNLVRYNVEEEKFQEILAEQREWIAEKEAQMEEYSDVYEWGTMGPVLSYDAGATLTMERCEELISYLE